MSDLVALQAALAAEDEVVYGYGVAGSRLDGEDREYATAALDAHRRERDRLAALIDALGASPTVARSAYLLPFDVNGPATARALAARLEQGSAGAAWDLVAASPPASATRRLAIRWLGDAAVRAAHWGSTQALPGRPR